MKGVLHLRSKGKDIEFTAIRNWFGDDYPWSLKSEKHAKSHFKSRLDEVTHQYDIYGNIDYIGLAVKKKRRSDIMETDIDKNECPQIAPPPQTHPELVSEKILALIKSETEEVQIESILIALDTKRPKSSLELQAFSKIKEVHFFF